MLYNSFLQFQSLIFIPPNTPVVIADINRSLSCLTIKPWCLTFLCRELQILVGLEVVDLVAVASFLVGTLSVYGNVKLA